MKKFLLSIIHGFLILLFFSSYLRADEKVSSSLKINYVQAFLDTLTGMHNRAENEFLKNSFTSIKEVITYYMTTSPRDTGYVKSLYENFINNSLKIKGTDLSSYTSRRLPLIISWVSPTDGKVSLSWLTLPLNWDPQKQYPMYLDLHCDFEEASNPIRYMVYPFLNPGDYKASFEDGYLFQPWGRGNEWYENIAETDIWESIHKLRSIVSIDYTRMYMFGFSMGGCGTWKISLKSPNYWAAIGILAGALSMGGDVVNEKAAQILKNLPVFWAMGMYDSFYNINYSACKLLIDAGNKNTKFIKFWGGHEYFETHRYQMYLWMKGFTNDDWTGIDDKQISSENNKLIDIYPNPVSSNFTINYLVPENSVVNISIVDLYGRTVSVIENSYKPTGNNKIKYDTDKLHSGIYFVVIKCGSKIYKTKLAILK